MKKNIYFLFLLFILTLSIKPVFAIDEKDLTVTCIYSDGISMTKYYDKIKEFSYVTNKNVAVSNSMQIEQDVTNYKILGCVDPSCEEVNGYKFQVAAQMTYHCPSVMYRWLLREYDNDTSSKTFSLYYYHQTSVGDTKIEDYFKRDNKVWPFNKKNITILDLDSTTVDKTNKYQEVALLVEKIEFSKDLTADKSCTYAYKAKQGAGTNHYITLYYFAASSSDYFYMDNGQYITRIVTKDSSFSHTAKEAIGNGTCKTKLPKICVKQSEQSINGNNEYEYNQATHMAYIPGQDMKCNNGYTLYEFTNDNNGNNISSNLNQICDTIPNTAIVLAKVLGYIQIIMPALVIVYTGIDIGKIVLAGNLEEELPKRKKSLFIRFIVMCLFFFIPIIIKVIMGNIYGTDVGAIDCLYNNNNTIEPDDSDVGEENSN